MDLQNFESISSKRIAKITGKRLNDVHRDIRNILIKLDGADLHHVEYQENKDKRGYTKEFILGEELGLVLATGYSIKLRLIIVKEFKRLRIENSQLKEKILALELTQKKDEIKDLTNALHLYRYDMNGKDWELEESFTKYK